MSFYQRLAAYGKRFIPQHVLMKYAFNWLSPMYARSTGRVTYVSKDLSSIRFEIPLTYRNSNYVGSIFGGSQFSACDPMPMVQLIQLLGDNYVVWDKSAEIYFRKPARETICCESTFSDEELEEIRASVASQKEMDFVKNLEYTDAATGKTVFSQIKKVIYIADKEFYKEKVQARKSNDGDE